MIRLATHRDSVQSRARRKPSPIWPALEWRPYCPVLCLPLAALLCELEYPESIRGQIVNRVRDGFSLYSLIGAGLLDSEDYDDAVRAVRRGRADHRRATMRRIQADAEGAQEWLDIEKREERRDLHRLRNEYPMRFTILDAPYLDPDADEDEWLDPALGDDCGPVRLDVPVPSGLDDEEEDRGPTDAEWDEMCSMSTHENTPSGWLD